MSKQLEKLYNKALEKGYANKNGRINFGSGYVSELQSQWEITYSQSGELCLSHWGTLILHVGKGMNGEYIVKDFYGQSKSDRDGICKIFNLMGLPFYASYRPSIDSFEMTADFGTGEVITKSI